MKKIITTLTTLVLLAPCGAQSLQKGKDYGVISGKLDFSTPNQKMRLIHNDKLFKEIAVGNDGSFRDTIPVISNDHTYYLEDPISLSLYIDNKTNIEIFMSMQPFKVTVSGAQAEQTQYFIERDHFFKEKISDAYNTLFLQEPQEFKKNIRALLGELKTKLESYNFDNEFLKNQQNWIDYNYVYALIKYPDIYKFFIRKEVELPKDFYAERDAIDFDNAQEFERNEVYRTLVKIKYFEQIGENPNNPERIDNFIKLISTLKSDNIRAYFAENLVLLIKPGNTENKKILNFILHNVKDKKVIQDAKEAYHKTLKLAPGKPAPLFTNYENAQGGTTSLTDLKGKRLYVSIWTTWCLPCKTKLADLRVLQEKLKGENIEFVSIAIDNDKQEWREMVKKREYKGVQLIADKASESQFIKECDITQIPTFLIIDEKGRIVSLNAPQPSDPDIEKVLKGKK